MTRKASLTQHHDAALRDLAAEKPLHIEVRGSSMEPWIRDRTTVEIAPSRWYWPGDVVAFRRGDSRLLVHRVVGYLPRRGRVLIVLQGDAMSRPDTPVPVERILGKVSGGDCEARIARPLPGDRFGAMWRFVRAGWRSLRGQ